jgi:hypothetical protein
MPGLVPGIHVLEHDEIWLSWSGTEGIRLSHQERWPEHVEAPHRSKFIPL